MKKFLPFIILFALLALVGFSTYKLNNKQEKNQESADSSDFNVGFEKIRITLPEFSFPDLYDENQDFSKKDLIGKYSIINFFASWCTTCHAEHEILLKLQSENILDIYGVAWRDIDVKTKEYLEKNGNPYKKTIKDSKGLFNKITGIEAIPETLIIDKDGNVVMRYRGNLQEFSIDQIRDFLKRNR